MLENKNAVITGGTEGIGFEIAKSFVENKANICLIARNKEKLIAVKKQLSEYGTKVDIIEGDLSFVSELRKISEQIFNVYPDINILVNNAGIGRFIPYEETDHHALDMHINLNVKAPYFLTQYLLASLTKNKGNVINISSYFSHKMLSGRDSTAYSLTKGAIDSFTKALAFEIGKKGVRINAIAPGSIKTPQLDINIEKLSEEGKEKFYNMIKTIYPMGKIGTPQDVANMAVFLASDKAKWITGSIMTVDGGLTTN